MAKAARVVDRLDVGFTEADAARLNGRYEGATTLDVIRALLTEIAPGETAIVSSFGTESAVLLGLVARVDPATPVIFLDTLKLFPETLRYRDRLIERLGLTGVRTVQPDPTLLATRDANELRWSYDPDGCCEIRKVIPLAAALDGFTASISGRKSFQSATRAALPLFEADGGRLKLNPLASWTKADLNRWFDANDLPRHPLEKDGYLSIGCRPCTTTVKPGEDVRAGRWRGWDKVECGIHTDLSELPSF
jgi:phosphoadenosine phosphosulfate reductase